MIDRTEASSSIRELCAVALILFGAAALYAGSYYTLVEPTGWTFGCGGPNVLEAMFPEYRVGGRLSAAVFAPANWIDRRVRRDTWSDAVWHFDRKTRTRTRIPQATPFLNLLND